jgi:hypothetical protein
MTKLAGMTAAQLKAGSGRTVAAPSRRRRCPRGAGVMVISAYGGAVVMDRANEYNGISRTHTKASSRRSVSLATSSRSC